MDVRRALLIGDPNTREQALGGDAWNCHLRSAVQEVACETLAAAYKRLSAERDAAVQDLTYVAKASAAYESSCALCAGGLGGGGGCEWPVDVDMPVDGCEKCGKCRCAWCAERSEWTWDTTRRAGQEAGYGR